MFLDDYNNFLELGEDNIRLREAIPPRITNGHGPDPFTGLAVENLSFSYPSTNRRVLEDVSMRVDPGEIVALVGGNGSGKTTLVKLICQLHEPDAGRILWNGIDTDTLAPDDVHADTTVIFQDFIQYHLPAADNIALGRVQSATDLDAVVAAAKQAGAHDFISASLRATRPGSAGSSTEGSSSRLDSGSAWRLPVPSSAVEASSFSTSPPPLSIHVPSTSSSPRCAPFPQGRPCCSSLTASRASGPPTGYTCSRAAESRSPGATRRLVELGGHYAELYAMQERAFLGMRAEL